MIVKTIATRLKVEESEIVSTLQQACEKAGGADGDLILDLSAVRRIQPSALRELEKLAAMADDRAITIMLRGVNVEVYKVLKLVKLASRFSFLVKADDGQEN